MFQNIYSNKKVLITGLTGFKGSWLGLWLEKLGAEVEGYSLNPPSQPNHFDLVKIDGRSRIGDIRDLKGVVRVFESFNPEIVFHLAAQPLVRYSYRHPIETFETNIMGTVNVLEACRQTASVRVVIIITSDKCYENREWIWGYRENDPMGGHDPYSCSKGCAELVTASYRRAFFFSREAHEEKLLLASVRAGNVIGGGDWAEDRLVPDLVRAADSGERLLVRSPGAVRPWQHVLEPLSGYLQLGQMLLNENSEFACAWNFGSGNDDRMRVMELVEFFTKHWKPVNFEILESKKKSYEAKFLQLDSSKARTILGWKPVWDGRTGIEKTLEWYRCFYERDEVITLAQIKEYMAEAKSSKLPWAIDTV